MPSSKGYKTHSVILSEVPADDFVRFSLIRKLTAHLKMAEHGTAAIVDNAPCILASVGSLTEAEGLQKMFSGLGAEVLITRYGMENLNVLKAAASEQKSISGRPHRKKWEMWLLGILYLAIGATMLFVYGMDTFSASIVGLLILGLVLIFYFLPTLVAVGHRKRNADAIFLVNLLFGWTLIGWLVAFVWASTETQQSS